MAVKVFSVADAFGNPDAAFEIDIDVGGIEKLRRVRPEGDFEAFGNNKEPLGNLLRSSVGEGLFLLSVGVSGDEGKGGKNAVDREGRRIMVLGREPIFR